MTDCSSRPIILIQMYEAAVKLIQKGKAYVCDLITQKKSGNTEVH